MTATAPDRSLLVASLAVVTAVGAWGIVDPASMVATASAVVDRFFTARGWFVMLSVTAMLLLSLALAFSRFGALRLGPDDSVPEYSFASWLAMLFAAGMGVGLLFWATAEPLSHFAMARQVLPDPLAAGEALVATNFHWGLHAWAIYGITALVIAYFTFRRGTPMLVGAPFTHLFPGEGWARILAWLSDFMAIAAIAIGVGGSMAMGVFQVADGVAVLTGREGAGNLLVLVVFLALVAAYIPPLLVDLGAGMSRLSNIAMLIAIGLVGFVVLAGPTPFLMNTVLTSFGEYVAEVLPRGFQTFTFFGEPAQRWYADWTLNYMVWWIAWAPFVGVFVARISYGRTIREFLLGVLIGPSLFSILWFGVFGGIGLFDALNGTGELVAATASNVERVTFLLLERLPFATATTLATVAAAFLFLVTSVVSAAFVLGTYATGGDPNPPARLRLIWGVLLGVLGYAMVLSGSVAAVRQVIALGALPFVFITVLLMACLLRALREEGLADADR
jgi:glycine betaine transporter